MGRAAVRTAAASYIQNLALPFVGTVYPARSYISETDYDSNMVTSAYFSIPPGGNYGCVIVVNITDDDRSRKADTGRGSVQDAAIHKMVLEVFFASTSGEPIPGQMAYDAIIDGLFVAIRADPLLGAPQTLWSAAEFTTGISHTQSEPYTDEEGTTVFITGTVRFDAWEWFAGSGV